MTLSNSLPSFLNSDVGVAMATFCPTNNGFLRKFDFSRDDISKRLAPMALSCEDITPFVDREMAEADPAGPPFEVILALID